MRLMLSLLLSLAAFPALAQSLCRGADGVPAPRTPPELAIHQFRPSGQGLACVLSEGEGQAMAAQDKPVTFLPCLKVGAVAVADTRHAVEDLLGTPATIRELDDHIEQRVYFVVQQSLPLPYYVVTYRDGQVVAVQLNGAPTDMPATFSSVSLGDDVQKVVDILGKPVRRCRLSPKAPESWLWPPFPIAVDLDDAGRVVSLKATWPVGR